MFVSAKYDFFKNTGLHVPNFAIIITNLNFPVVEQRDGLETISQTFHP